MNELASVKNCERKIIYISGGLDDGLEVRDF